MKENNDGNDTNVGSIENSIEEDIKCVRDFLEYSQDIINDMDYERPVDVTIYQQQINSIEHILSDYKKLKEEFKAVDHECSRLERKEVEMEKIIDLIIKDLYKQAHISTRCYLQISIEECMKNKNCIECLKQHFKNKAKEVISND